MACSRPAHTGKLTGGAGSDLAIPFIPSGGHCLQPGLWQLLSVGVKGKEVGCWVLSLDPSAPSLKYWEWEGGAGKLSQGREVIFLSAGDPS